MRMELEDERNGPAMNAGKRTGTEKGGYALGARLLPVVPLILALALFVTACGDKAPRPPAAESVPATVNGQQIGLQEFLDELALEQALIKEGPSLKAGDMESLKEEALTHLIEERLMLQRARELALAVRNEELTAKIEEIRNDYGVEEFKGLFGEDGARFPAWREALRKRMLLEKLVAQDVNAKVEVTDGEAESYYKANLDSYLTKGRVRAAQVVLRDRDRAEAILKRLKAGEDFGKVAREVSMGPEAVKGGDLGFFERGVMPEAIDRVVFFLPVGKLSGIVQSPYGYHIFKLLAREDVGGGKFAEVKNRVIADLRKLKEAEAYEKWIEGLKAQARIQINRPLPDGPPPARQGNKAASPQAGAGKH